MPIATCRKVDYEEGSFTLTSGVKRSAKDYHDSERSFENRGTGWGTITFHSHLWLYTNQGRFDLASFFRSKFQQPGKKTLLTKKRRDRIIATMPSTINLISGPDNKLVPDPVDLEKWFTSL